MRSVVLGFVALATSLLSASGNSIIIARPALNNVETQVDSILQAMPIEQRVGQLFMVSLYGEELSTTGQTFLKDMMPGAVAMFSYNGTSPQAINQTVNAWQTEATKVGSKVPLIVAIDQEGGPVTRLVAGFTQFPWGTALAAMPTTDAETVGRLAGEELAAVGINMNLAPVVDLRTLPDNPIMEKRMIGSDPLIVGTAASAYIQGMSQSGVIGVLKHFPGHGAAADSHNLLPTVNYSYDHVFSIELGSFRTAIKSGAEAVMVGHIVYPALDPTPGLPASLSPTIIGNVLRGDLGFTGVTISDAMDMGAIVDNFSRPKAAVMAVKAGIDMIAVGPHTPITEQLAMRQAILDAVTQGEISSAQIEDAVRHILTLKERYGLLKWIPLDPTTATQRINVTAHEETVAQIYQNTVSIVTDPLHHLPLNPGAQKVAVIYPGSFPSVKRECARIDMPYASYAYTLSPDASEQAAARSISHDADVVIVFTYNIGDYPAQADLINNITNDKMIVVALQSPYDIQRGIHPSAYVAAFNATPSAFSAVCALLYGLNPPVGHWQP